MKIIKSKSYIKKKAIWSNMPVGDPGLPGQLTERDIGYDSPEPNDATRQPGESEIDVNWPEFKAWYGYEIPSPFKEKARPSSIKIDYVYDYDYNAQDVGQDPISHIKPVKIMDYETKSVIPYPDPTLKEDTSNYNHFVESLMDYYDELIKKNITESENM